MIIQTITILGSTGSIGLSTLDVVKRHPDRYRILALTAHSRVQELAEQCLQYLPQFAVVGTAEKAAQLEAILKKNNCKTDVLYGEGSLCQVASLADIVMAAIVGAAGLAPTLAAAKSGKKVLLANKEALVMSGQLFMDAVALNGATLLPIDSEHNAIFQCLPATYHRNLQTRQGVKSDSSVAKIVLMASGGPFLKRDLTTFDAITPEQAIAHPNWVMGKKISIDSASMMNKGLEVIEAHWLFNVPIDKIEVVIHPESVIHSMVSYVDGSMLAQLGNPDMRTPIAYGLAYPERIDAGIGQLDLAKIAQLNFELPDFERFPCLGLAFAALRFGGTAPAALNAANEIAVQAFLDKKIKFTHIASVIEQVMEQIHHEPASDLEIIMAQDEIARALANSAISLFANTLH